MITIIRRLLGITRESLNHAEVHVEPRGSTWRGSPPNFRVLMVLLCSCALVLTCAPGTLHAVDNTFTDDVKGRSGTDVRLDEGMVDTPYGGLGRYENLLTYSDTFDNSVWAKTNVTSPTADQIIAPNGSTTAEALAPTAAAATNVKNTSAAAATASTSYTFSTWLKAASGTKDIVLTVGDTAANNTATASLTTAWQRFSVTYTSSGTPSGNVFGQIGDAAWTADTIHAWGAQLEQASSPGVYAKAAANAITSGRGIISTSDIIMPGLKLTEGDIANIVGNTIILDDDVDITGSLKVTGAGPHYISQGNVGIGTVSPAQKLHVEGQCVTGDTMLSIFEKDVQGSRFKVQGIMIKDVKPGMMVYSLNEELGIIEPHRILALLDMGIKPVFKLITKDGKSIRTTGNHPYLTREGWKKVVELEAGQRIAVPREINGHASYVGGGQYKTKSTQNQGILMSLLWRPLFFSFPGIDNYAQDKQSNTQCYETYSQSNRKFFKEITGKSDSKYGLTKISDNLRDKFSGCFIKNYHDFREQLYHSFDNLSSKAYAGLAQPLPEHLTEQYEFSDMRTIWLHEPVIARSEATPVRRSHIGQNKGVGGKQSHLEPRTSNLERYVLWAEIESIEYIGYEQVYDIEVEGTHNFIGNGIIAHNTYLNGNVGIGTTAPTGKLQVFTTGSSKALLVDDTTGYVAVSAGASDSAPVNPLTVGSVGGIGSDLNGNSALFVAQGSKTYGLSFFKTGATVGIESAIALGSQVSGGVAKPYATLSSYIEDPDASLHDGSLIMKTALNGALVERVRITSTGNVGIGTSSPLTKLHILDTAAAASILANDTGGGDLLQLQVNGTDKFVINSEGLISTGAGGGWIEAFTAAAGQTAFTLTAGTYTPDTNELLVFRNGVTQLAGSSADYVETNSTTITFNHRMLVGENVFVQRKGTIAAGSSGDITGVTAGTGLTGGGANGSVTLNVDVGTTANKIVQLDANAKLPAVDGSQLTNLSGGAVLTSVQVFTASGTWTKPAGITKIRVQLVGGGGGGGGGGGTYAGAGGSAGGYSEKIIDVSAISTVSVTIGAGGPAVSGIADGNNGGTTSFGAYLSATGGGRGNYAGASATPGLGANGDINLYGGYGGGKHNRYCGSDGGASYFGGGGYGSSDSYNPFAATAGLAPGSGGGGASDTAFTTSGAGANGIVMVWEYGS